MKEITKQIIEEIEKAKTICILTHENPDGDAIGSSTAMYEYILQNFTEKDVDLYINSKPTRYKFLELTKYIKEEIDLTKQYDLAIALDCASLDRLHQYEELFSSAKRNVQIDHHVTNTNYADVNLIKELSSTCGLLYLAFTKAGLADTIDILNCIFTGIITDTNCFKNSNVTSNTFKITAELVEKGVDTFKISDMLYNKSSLVSLRAIAYTIDNLELYNKNRIAYIYISREIMTSIGLIDDDIEGLIDYLKMIDTVEVAILAKERTDGSIKISTRSTGEIDVAKLCKKFGGGGHVRAAGCKFSEDVNYKKLILEYLDNEFKLDDIK